MKSLISTLTTFILFATVTVPSFAVTPKQFLEETKDHERSSYVFGALEMAMGMLRIQGQTEKAECAFDLFANNPDESNKELISTLNGLKDRDFTVASVIYIIINRHCGNADAANAQN